MEGNSLQMGILGEIKFITGTNMLNPVFTVLF